MLWKSAEVEERTGRELKLGENRSVPKKRRAAGWRLWKHTVKGAGLGFKVKGKG